MSDAQKSSPDMCADWEKWKASPEWERIGPDAKMYSHLNEADRKHIQGAMWLAFTMGWQFGQGHVE